MRAQLHLQHQHAVGRCFVFTVFFWEAETSTEGVKKETDVLPQQTAGQKEGLPKGSSPSLPCQTHLVLLWDMAGVGTSAWLLVWKWGHSPEPALPPGNTSPHAAAHQHHMSCCTVGIEREERDRERLFFFFKFFYSSQVHSSSEASQSLLWRLFLSRFGSNPTMISKLCSPLLLNESLPKLGLGQSKGGVCFHFFNATQNCFCSER